MAHFGSGRLISAKREYWGFGVVWDNIRKGENMKGGISDRGI